jgi:hypothetical protein
VSGQGAARYDAAMRLVPGVCLCVALGGSLHAQSTPYAEIRPNAGPSSPGPISPGPSTTTDTAIVMTWYEFFGNSHCARSFDGGRSWSETAMTGSSSPVVAITGSGHRVYAILGNPQPPTCLSSFDDGATWQSSGVIHTPVSGATGRSVAAAGLLVHVLVFADIANATTGVYYTRSIDGGLTWPPASAAILLGSPGTQPPHARMALAAGVLHVAWMSARGGVDYVRSTDGGLTWSQPNLLVIGSVPFDLAASGNDFYVAHASGTLHSTDAGITWASNGNGAAFTQQMRIAADGLSVCVAGPGASFGQFLVTGSVDGGANWNATTQGSYGSVFSGSANLNDVFVHGTTMGVMIDGQGQYVGLGNVYFPAIAIVSDDGGASWQHGCSLDQLGTTGARFAAVGDSCLAIWGFLLYSATFSDNVRCSLLYGYQPYGAAKPGSGNVAPRLDGIGRPLTGGGTSIAMTQSLGGAVAAIGATFAGPADIPFGAGSILLQPPTVAIWSITSGAGGVAGAGATSLPLAIPANPALRATRVDFQGFVLDPGAADGFASTAGVEMWVF